MKVTEAVIRMMFELSAIEGDFSTEYLNAEGALLRNNLLTLFNQTRNQDSQDLIIRIMNEAGYPWFGALANTTHERSDVDLIQPSDLPSSDTELDEETFMLLIPANGYIH